MITIDTIGQVVDLELDPNIPDLLEIWRKACIEHRFYIQAMLMQGGFAGQLNPVFRNDKTFLDYIQVSPYNVAFVVTMVHHETPMIGIDLNPNILKVDGNDIVSVKDGTKVYFIPRMINFDRIITFDAYTIGTKSCWSKIVNLEEYPYQGILPT